MESKQTPLRLDGNVERGRPVQITVDGQSVQAYEGESIAAAMLAAGRRALRQAHPHPRGVFCGMGICYECTVTVVGHGQVRACIATVQDGMQVATVNQ